ncbi:MAG: hypothetical protein HZB57_10705, partial [Gammaproteobacteria bacterium]|nr:hypothetical protein [Gammaproteobacteria bacterium]
GGSGNDLLYGDSYYSPYSPDVDIDWRVWDFSIDYSISNDGNHATFNANLFSVFEGTNTEPDGNDILYGGQGIDVIYGEGGDDILSGDDDVDSLTGGAGKDLLMGGVGDDWLWGDDGEDVTITGDDTLLGEAGVDHLYGGPGNDVLFGGADGDRLKGDDMLDSISVSGNDTLYGEGGDDELIGGPGDDYLDGGAGADSLFGDQDERFPGMVGNDILIGGAGDDYLDGGAGADVLYGGEGDDIYVVDDASDVIAENDAEGVDTVLVSFDYVLPNNIENIAILSSVMANATGDARANRLFGSEFTNTLEGLGGDDLLFGRAGDDVLNGGVGVDQLFGENGNDRLNGGVQNDTLYGGAGDDVFVATLGSGTDIIIDVEGINAVEFGAGITQDSLDLVQYQGDDGAYYLRVNYGASGDAIIIKNGPSGAIQSYRFNDGSSVTHEALMGQEPVPLLIDGTPYNDVIHGSAMADRVDAGLGDDQIYGAAGADTLMGGQGADTLDGGADNDTLDGGVGNDTLLGGAGEDRYVLQWGMGSDLVIEDGAALSTLELGYGVQLSDLDIWRDQNDLMVRFAGSTGGVRIQGYGASPLNWQIQDESGTAHALEDFVTQPPSTATPLDFEDVASGFVNTVRSNFIETLMQPGESTGYTMAADGVLRKVNSYVSDNYSATVHESANIVVEDVSTNSDAYVQDTQAYTNDYSYSQTSIRVATMTSMLGSTGGMSGYGAGTRSYHSFATNASYEIPSGAGVVTVYGPTVDQDGGQDVQLDGYTGEIGTQQPIGVWVFDNGAGTGIPTIVTHDISHRDDTLTLERVTGGAGNNAITVEGHAVVDGGSGDDSIVANAVRWEYSYANEFTPNPYGYTGQFDSRNHGALLFGNAGADQIAGGAANDLLIGGAGDDSIDGRMGEDVYVVRQGEGGYDIVADSGTFVRINYETGASRYADWYYQSLGIPDYVDRLLRGETIPPLPPLSPNDFDAMAQLAQSEVIETDTVEFAEGINLDQLTLTWGEVVLNSPVPPESQPWMDEQGMQFRTLDISWAEGEGVRIVIPHTYVSPPPYEDDVPLGVIGSFTYDRSDESLGLGIEQFRFADGTVLSMEQMVALAPAMPSLDPYLAVGDLTLIGTAGDDVLTGQEGNDILDGDAGSDTLDGGAGDDTYILNGGDGFDLIGDVSGTDSIVYGPGIAFGDIRPLLAGGQVYLSNQNGSEDAVVIGGWGAAPVIENFVFEDAGQISAATLLAPRWSTYFDADLGQWNTVVVSSSGSVAVTASGSANGEISGTAQADLIVASGYVISGDGDDELHGLNGADTFEGGAGADNNDTLNGGSGNDYLGGFSGDDVLNGGSGADTMLGGEGNDTYYVDDMADVVTELSGHGEDTVNSAVNYALTAEVEWLRLTGDDSIDGTGNTSANTLFGNTGANVLMGDAGDDALLGRMGNDTLGGGAGNDSLTGGQGNDTYRFGRGDDVDTVVDYDAMDADPAVYGATVDVVRLGGDIAHDQLWFSRSGHDLQIGVIGTEDRMTLQDWYRGAAYQVDEVYAGDGYRLLNDQVDQLVQAMAAFAPPAGGELDLPANYRPDLDPVIAVNWQAA